MEELTRRMERCNLQYHEIIRAELRYLANMYYYGTIEYFPCVGRNYNVDKFTLFYYLKEELNYINPVEDDNIVELLINVYLGI